MATTYDTLKSEADALFRAKKFVDAIDKYTAAIESEREPHGVEKCYSNRAACREKLAASTYGAEKTALIEQGREDGRRCVAIDPAFVRGYQRLATFLALSIKDAADRVYDNDDYQSRDNDNASDDDNNGDDVMGSFAGRSASADKAVLRLRRELEGIARRGLALDPVNESLLEALQTLRDVPAEEFDLDREMAPTDAELSAAEDAGKRSAVHKAAGAKAFGGKDWVAADKAYTKALACDPLSAATVPLAEVSAADGAGEQVTATIAVAAGQATAVLYSNRSAARASQEKYASALRDADWCVDLRPAWSKGQSRRATALFGLGRYDEAEAACIAGIALDTPSGEKTTTTTGPLHSMLARCQRETCEPPAVQREMYRLRQKAKQDAQLQKLMAGLSGNGGAGGPQVFNMNNLNFSGGGNPFANLGGAMGGLGGMGGGMGQQPKMTEQQMREMARAVASSGGSDVGTGSSASDE